MEKWVVAAKRADFQGIAAKYGIDPVIARLIRNRDVVGEEEIEEYLYGGKESMHDPMLMKDMEKAVEILQKAIQQRKKIRIVGDYDIDGIMSSYILSHGLKQAGADAEVQIPDRITDGYGINENIVKKAAEDQVELLLTCDNGIAAWDQIRLAKELGMQVIVTDHHDIPFMEEEGEIRYRIPPADAVINPKQKDCRYPFSGLCGGAVAYKLITALFRKQGLPEEMAEKYMEYAAFATVGDIMELQKENRVLVKLGLEMLRKTQNVGMQELMRVNNLEPEQVNVYHIGFILGPCLNASGRLDTAQRSLRLLWEERREEAAVLAGDLKNLNESRKEMTKEGEILAENLVENSGCKEDRVLVLFLEDCHESLAGIIAGRIREKYHKPVFVLTRTEEGVKGSGRSIETYSMYEEMCKCREVFTKFGGHPMAAGLSMEENQVPIFRKKINELCTLTEADLVEKVVIDVPMPISYIRKDLIRQMQLLQPFGKGNTKPLFAQKNLEVLNCRILGKNRNVAKAQLMDEQGYCLDAVCFGDAEEFFAYVSDKKLISVVYYPEIHEWQGRESIQLTIIKYQ